MVSLFPDPLFFLHHFLGLYCEIWSLGADFKHCLVNCCVRTSFVKIHDPAPFFVLVVMLVSRVIEPPLMPPEQRPPEPGSQGHREDVLGCSIGATLRFSP